MIDQDKTLGQLAFEEYCRTTGGVVVYGRIIDDWSMIGPAAQAAWYAAALAAVEAVYHSRRFKRIAKRHPKPRQLTLTW